MVRGVVRFQEKLNDLRLLWKMRKKQLTGRYLVQDKMLSKQIPKQILDLNNDLRMYSKCMLPIDQIWRMNGIGIVFSCVF